SARVQAFAGGLDADQLDGFVLDVGMEDADGIRPATHRGDHIVGLAACVARHLFAAFAADDGLEVAHHAGIGIRAGHGADDVEGVLDIGDPVAHGLVQGVLQGARARFDGHHRGAQQLHAVDVGRLSADVLAAHVDHAFHAVARRHGGRGHPVLARTGLGDHARLAHAPGEQGLADAVVDLVGAGVVQVFALEPDLRAAQLFGPAPRVVDRTGPADEVLQLVGEFALEIGVVAIARIGFAQRIQGVHERLGDE